MKISKFFFSKLINKKKTIKNLDVEGIKFVINYDYPQSSEDYIHRIGRTGRSSQTGTSYAFFTDNNSKQARDLVSVLQEANQKIDTQLAEMARKNYGGGGGRGNFSRGFGTFKRGSMSNGGGRPSNNRFSNYQSNNFGGAPKTNGYSGGNGTSGGASGAGGGGGGYSSGGNRNHTRFD